MKSIIGMTLLLAGATISSPVVDGMIQFKVMFIFCSELEYSAVHATICFIWTGLEVDIFELIKSLGIW